MSAAQDEPVEIKEWLKVSHSATNQTTVTVTLQEGNCTSKWSVKAYAATIAAGVEEARAGAQRALKALREVVS